MTLFSSPPRYSIPLVAAVLLAGATVPALAGTYLQVFDRGMVIPGPDDVPPFAIMHPIGYDGSGGMLTIGICVRPGSEELVPAVQSAIALWNALKPTVGNCVGCYLWEEPAPPESYQDARTVVIHELGHCAMGLGHINLKEDERAATMGRIGSCDVNQNDTCGEETSFTASFSVTDVTSGAGTVLGDSEDVHANHCPIFKSVTDLVTPLSASSPATSQAQPSDDPTCLLGGLGCQGFPTTCCPACPGPECPNLPWNVGDMSFFRTADNNPFMIDSTVIDNSTFSRSEGSLPTGHNYAASANRAVGEVLGFPNSQSVMYSLARDGTRYLGLTADDVNMVKMGMTGADREAGTADDYAIELVYDTECTFSEIEVQLENEYISPGDTGTPGVCVADIQDSFSQPPVLRFHHTLVPFTPVETRIVVELNPAINWDFSHLVFLSGFETGDLSEWSDVVEEPPP